MLKPILYFLLTVCLAAADQYAKRAALLKLSESEIVIRCRGMVRLSIVRNRGAAFGLLRNRQFLLKLITIPLAVIVVLYLLIEADSGSSAIYPLSLAFIAGGAAGNLIDRFKQNYVVDFFSLNFRRLPFFNLADLFILSGFIMFILWDL